MLGHATKYFAGLAAAAFVALLTYGLVEAIGKAAFNVDDADYRPLGIALFAGLFVATAVLTGLGLAFGDAPSTDRLRQRDHPAQPVFWPLLAAMGATVLMVGLVVDTALTIVGLLVIAFAAVEWVLSAWSERLSTDPAHNEDLRRHLARPFELPVLAAALVAGPILLFSRVLLTTSRNAASYIALGLMVAIVAVAFIFYALPNLRREVIMSVMALGALALIVIGIVSAARGTREIEHHEEEGVEAVEEAEEGAMPSPSDPVVLLP
jgi:hypothetical protein